ncbi:MAG: efflux RND transporter periplasmic adaptor subunit [Verrucomicrobia bacterium]|nr:efflux RND transporter periplasmic adaptor subunit [Verrucomicrobiota bacterium]
MSHRHILPLLAAAALFGAGCNRQKPVTVTTEKAQRRNLTEVVTGSGKLQPVVQVKISSEVAGEIIDLPVKEGQHVRKGDLLVRVRPDLYAAALRSQEASLKSSQADLLTAEANARKAEAELKRNEDLFSRQLISGSLFDEIRTGAEVARANAIASTQRIEMARASLKRSQEDLAKTIIFSPIDGTISKLNSESGERVSGTGMMAGTDIMTVADLTKMEARVEVGEMDVVLIQPGFKARLDVDSFKDRKFDGQVTQVARSAKTTAGGSQQESTKFEVRIRMADTGLFLPGMSVTADIETRYRTNVITVPIQAVTTRMAGSTSTDPDPKKTGSTSEEDKGQIEFLAGKKARNVIKPIEVVFVREIDKAKMLPVKRGISDDSHYEILEGVTEGQEIITGNFKAISKELNDGSLVQLEEAKKAKDSKP